MNVLSLFKKNCPNKIPVKVGKSCGEGADGEVFQIKNDSDKVIKFCVMYEDDYMIENFLFEEVNSILLLLYKEQFPSYARVYECGYAGYFNRKYFERPKGQNYILYYYVMEKLHSLSDKEYVFFNDHIIDNIYSNNFNFLSEKINKLLESNIFIDKKKIITFCKDLLSAPIIQDDFHAGNIMKDIYGNYKMIDFDRCKIEENQ